MTVAKIAFEAQMAGFRLRFAERLYGEAASLRAALDAFRSAPGEHSCRALRSIAHKLAGSGGLLGFSDIGAAAARVDDQASAALEGGALVADDVVKATHALLDVIATRTQAIAR